jgi:hypothetical protein
LVGFEVIILVEINFGELTGDVVVDLFFFGLGVNGILAIGTLTKFNLKEVLGEEGRKINFDKTIGEELKAAELIDFFFFFLFDLFIGVLAFFGVVFVDEEELIIVVVVVVVEEGELVAFFGVVEGLVFDFVKFDVFFDNNILSNTTFFGVVVLDVDWTVILFGGVFFVFGVKG